MRDQSTLFRVAPTFPIDDRKVRELRYGRIFESPVTWGSLAAAMGIGVLSGTGVLGYVLLLGLAGWGVHRFWQSHWADLEADCLQSVIRGSNIAQDAELNRIIRLLEDRGSPQYAVCLGRFLLLKQKIEGALHSDDVRRTFAPEIERLVDGICSEVCREVTELINREDRLGEALTSRDEERLRRLESARMESHASILHAYTTLFQAYGELGRFRGAGMLGVIPAPEIPDGRNATLAGMVDELRDEADHVARTQRRLREDLGAGAAQTATSSVPEMVAQ